MNQVKMKTHLLPQQKPQRDLRITDRFVNSVNLAYMIPLMPDKDEEADPDYDPNAPDGIPGDELGSGDDEESEQSTYMLERESTSEDESGSDNSDTEYTEDPN